MVVRVELLFLVDPHFNSSLSDKRKNEKYENMWTLDSNSHRVLFGERIGRRIRSHTVL